MPKCSPLISRFQPGRTHAQGHSPQRVRGAAQEARPLPSPFSRVVSLPGPGKAEDRARGRAAQGNGLFFLASDDDFHFWYCLFIRWGINYLISLGLCRNSSKSGNRSHPAKVLTVVVPWGSTQSAHLKNDQKYTHHIYPGIGILLTSDEPGHWHSLSLRAIYHT